MTGGILAINIDKTKCPQDHKCPAMSECPVGALSQEGNEAPKIDADLCIECGMCASVCPMGALHFE